MLEVGARRCLVFVLLLQNQEYGREADDIRLLAEGLKEMLLDYP